MKGSNIVISLFLLTCLSLFLLYVPHPTGKVVDSSPSSAVIDTGIQVMYFTFDGSNTDLVSYTDEELEAVVNLTLEKMSCGAILWPSTINLTEDVVDNMLDLDTNITCSHNFLEVDITQLPSLQGPAVISLYNIPFNNPRVIRNGVVCPESICSIMSYQGGVLTFSVTQFSHFYAEETPSVGTAAGTGGGGRSGSAGGGGAATPKATMISKDIMKIYLTVGEAKTEYLTLQNKEQKNKKVTLMFEGLEAFISPKETSYVFTPGEIKDIPLILTAQKDMVPGVYYGTIFLSEGESITPIRVVIEVRKNTEQEISVVVKNKEVFAGDTLLVLVDTDEQQGSYEIVSVQGGVVAEGELAFPEEGTINIAIPREVGVGDYLLVVFAGDTYASDFFEVIATPVKEPYVDYPFKERPLWPFVLFCMVLTLLVIVLFLRKKETRE